MPISVTCQCGKALRLKDEWVGKQAKCPGCGVTFMVPAMGGPVKPVTTVAGPELYGSRQRPQEKEGIGSAISLSPKVITFLIVAVSVPVLIYLVKIGPVAARNQWEIISPKAESDITDVVTKAIQAESHFNTAEARHAPGVQAVTMDATIIYRVPEVVGFSGRSSNGFFNGKYNTKTGEVTAAVPRGWSAGTMVVTGRVKNGKIDAEIDGKEAKLIFRPKTKEELD